MSCPVHPAQTEHHSVQLLIKMSILWCLFALRRQHFSNVSCQTRGYGGRAETWVSGNRDCSFVSKETSSAVGRASCGEWRSAVVSFVRLSAPYAWITISSMPCTVLLFSVWKEEVTKSERFCKTISSLCCEYLYTVTDPKRKQWSPQK